MIRLILLTDFTEAFAQNLLKGILEYSKEGEPWAVCRMPPSFKQRFGIKGVLQWAKKWETDAIIAQFDNTDRVELFKKNKIVALAQDYKSRFKQIPNITSDYLYTGKVAAEFFIEKGFHQFAFYGYKDVFWSEERCKGFKDHVTQLGFGEHFYELQRQRLEDLWFYELEPVSDWLKSLPKPIALMTCDDNQGNKILEACRLCDIKVPEEVAVLGVDNDETICNLSDPPLSSVKLNVQKGGYEAAKLINRLIKDKEASSQDVYILTTGIANRLSTDAFSTDDSSIQKALKYIHQHIHQSINVTDVVNTVPLSRRLLEIRFKQVTKQSVYQYIYHLRMEHFAQLLLSSNQLISDLVIQVGLGDSRNLARQFKLVKGCTPQDYRKKNRLKTVEIKSAKIIKSGK